MEKVLQKALKKLGIEEDKFARAQELIELLKEEVEVPEEETPEVVEPTKVEPEAVKVDAPTPPKQVDYDDIRKQLGLDKYEAVIVEQDKAIKELREDLKKSRSAGYTPNQSNITEDKTVEDIFANLNKLKLK